MPRQDSAALEDDFKRPRGSKGKRRLYNPGHLPPSSYNSPEDNTGRLSPYMDLYDEPSDIAVLSERIGKLEGAVASFQTDFQEALAEINAQHLTNKQSQDDITALTEQLATSKALTNNVIQAFLGYLYKQYSSNVQTEECPSRQRNGKQDEAGNKAAAASGSMTGFRSFVRDVGYPCSPRILSEEALTDFIRDYVSGEVTLSRPTSGADTPGSASPTPSGAIAAKTKREEVDRR